MLFDRKTINLEATCGGGTAYLLQQRYGVGVKQSTGTDVHTVKAGTCLPRMLETTGTSSDVVGFMKRAKGSEPKRPVDALCDTSRAKPGARSASVQANARNDWSQRWVRLGSTTYFPSFLGSPFIPSQCRRSKNFRPQSVVVVVDEILLVRFE
jgi:hypothetical protein